MATDFEGNFVEATNQWGTLSFDVPDFLKDIRGTVNDVVGLLTAALELANLALDFAKAFLLAYVDPIDILIGKILDEIRAILDDLSQIGLYITGDWTLLGWPPEELRGGYPVYERRMMARLTDRSDPTRPDVSAATTVFGFFGYLSADVSKFEDLVKAIRALAQAFGVSYFPDTSSLPVPTIVDVKYGARTADLSDFSNYGTLSDVLFKLDGAAPQKARVVWETRPPASKHPLNPLPALGPSGFLVTVSTIEGGIPLKFSRPVAGGGTKPARDGELMQAREHGNIVDGNLLPVILHGGAEMLRFEESPFGYNANIDPKTRLPKNGGTQVYGIVDSTGEPAFPEEEPKPDEPVIESDGAEMMGPPEPETPAEEKKIPASSGKTIIPLEELSRGELDGLGRPGDGKGSDFLFQRTFLVPSGTALAHWFTEEASVAFDIDDMPDTASFETKDGLVGIAKLSKASTYWVRVWSVMKQVATEGVLPGWDFEAENAVAQRDTSGQPFRVDPVSGTGSIGAPSAPRKITFVGANTKDYLEAIQTALLVMVLSRSDLPVLDESEDLKTKDVTDAYLAGLRSGTGFAIERTGLESGRHLMKRLFDEADIVKPGQDPKKWQRELYVRIRQLVQDTYDRTGPIPELERVVVARTENLRSATWQSLSPGLPASPLFRSLNPFSEVGLGSPELGLAPNIHSMGIPERDVEELFKVKGLLTRAPAFSERVREEWGILSEEKDPISVRAFLSTAPPGVRGICRRFVKPDGSLEIPTEWVQCLQNLRAALRTKGSADAAPVFYTGRTVLQNMDSDSAPTGGSVTFCRNLFTPEIYREAAFVLNMATAATDRSPEDGAWVALRLFGAFPELEEFLMSLLNWAEAVKFSVRSVVDTLIKYIEFVQSQIVELQQLIRRIDAMIKSLLAFRFTMPSVAGLMLVSAGTAGIAVDLANAVDKPVDGPKAYGGGVALVIPLAPTFFLDLFSTGNDDAPLVTRPPDAVGVEKLPAEAGPAPTDEPDVL